MVGRLVVTGAIVAALLLWPEAFPVPDWALIGFVVILVPLAVALTVKRLRLEGRLVRTVWQAWKRP